MTPTKLTSGTIDGNVVRTGDIIGRRFARGTYRVSCVAVTDDGDVAWVEGWGGSDGPFGQHAGWHAISAESVRFLARRDLVRLGLVSS